MRPHGQRILAAAIAVAVLVGGSATLGATPAGAADAITAKRREAVRLAERIEAQGDRLSRLDEDYNETRLRLTRLQASLAAAEAEEKRASARLSRLRTRLESRAIASYVDPARLSPLARLSTGDLDADVTRSVYLGTVNRDDREVLDALGAAREDLQRERAAAARAGTAVSAELQRLASQRRDAEALLARQRSLLVGVKGDLATLLAEEQARREAEEARRARDDLARRQAEARAELARRQAAAARPPTGATAGGTAAGTGSSARAGQVSRDLAVIAGLAPEPPASPSAARAVAAARTLLGLPYRWGGEGPGSFDCSGLVLYAYRQAGGPRLPHSSRAQYASTTRVSVSNIRPGDLVFFGRPIHHVGMYIGGGKMIEAPRSGYNVKVASMFRRDLVGVGRVS